MPPIHVSLAGHEIKYEDLKPDVAKFVKRAQALADDPKSTEDDLVVLVYGSDNPILDRTLFPERGMVTEAVLKNPVYHLLQDLLARKRAAIKGQTAEQLGRSFTLTVAQAAEQTGVSEDAINKGIRARRIPSWVKDGQRYLDPRTFAALGLGERGTLPEGFMRLKVRVGASQTGQLRVKHSGGELPSKAQPIPYAIETSLPRSRRVAVLMAGHDKLRMFVLEPGETEHRHGFDDYWFEGNFTIVEKINSSAAARKAWEGFKAS